MIAFWEKKKKGGGVLVKSGGILVIQWGHFGKTWGVLVEGIFTCGHLVFAVTAIFDFKSEQKTF